MSQAKQLLSRRDPSDPAYARLREALITARKAAGFSQQTLADKVGRPQSFIAKIERGERYVDLVEFLVLARILKINVVELIASIGR
jgi:ribosome-binding protein aMBF1 (putative translation factor)